MATHQPHEGPTRRSRQVNTLFRAIDHVGIAVQDLEAAIATYTKTYGMRVVHRETNEEQGVYEVMLAVSGSESSAGPFVQLVAPIDQTSPVARFLAKRGEGLHQIAYAVDDIETTSDQLRNDGVALLYEQPRPGTGGSRVNFIHPKQAGGVLVELVERVDVDPDNKPNDRMPK
jgi:methylmalonyl-CoA/ethylmalonyl-CoA epimerase